MKGKIGWALVFAAALAAGYALGRWHSGDWPHAEFPTAKSAIAPPRDIAPENHEYVAAVWTALDEPMLLERTQRTAELLSQLSPSNAGDAFSTLQRAGASRELKELLIDVWVRFDPDGAFEVLQGLSTFARNELIPPMLESWATLDPGAARQAFESLPQDADTSTGPFSTRSTRASSSLSSLAKGWARSGEPGLLEFLSEQVAGSYRQEVVEYALEIRTRRDGREAVMEWADEVMASDDFSRGFKGSFLNRTAAVLMRDDPEVAAPWAAKYAEGEYAGRVMAGATNRWLVRDGPAAMQWFASLPASPERDDAVKQAYEFWLRQKPDAATSWIEEAPAERAFEPAVAVYAPVLAETSPGEALIVAERITDPLLRGACLIEVGRAWYAKAPGPATAWLERSELSAEQRESVTETRETAGGKPRARKRKRDAEHGSKPQRTR